MAERLTPQRVERLLDDYRRWYVDGTIDFAVFEASVDWILRLEQADEVEVARLGEGFSTDHETGQQGAYRG